MNLNEKTVSGDYYPLSCHSKGTWSTAWNLFAQKNCSTQFCFYSTAFEQTIFIVSIGRHPYLTCFEVGSTGFEQLLLYASTAPIVNHFTFEQLTL